MSILDDYPTNCRAAMRVRFGACMRRALSEKRGSDRAADIANFTARQNARSVMRPAIRLISQFTWKAVPSQP